jgi:sulfur transfer protein SufE
MSSHQTEQAQLLIDTFAMLGEWEDRYRFIIDLGRQMPPMEASAKVDENKVRGCLSSVWVVASSREENGERVVDFVADSDSAIVKGLVAILRQVYSGQTARDIIEFDIDGLFQRLDLAGHLSMGRRNGLAEMVTRVKALAAEQAAS